MTGVLCKIQGFAAMQSMFLSYGWFILRLEKSAASTEKLQKIAKRWHIGMAEYDNVKDQLVKKKREHFLQLMRSKACDVQYLSSLRAKYTGKSK